MRLLSEVFAKETEQFNYKNIPYELGICFRATRNKYEQPSSYKVYFKKINNLNKLLESQKYAHCSKPFQKFTS